ncbi:arginase family protein [Ruicaihuangia caeni]|uniref:arginase family protein n=1 Tax=Ruicaihuangia caeni TaxID=3042517 RepID=UPI00338ED2FD
MDPLWPRAGGWAADTDPAGGPVDLAVLGVPAHLTSLSPTNAHLTPREIRDALRRYSPWAMSLGAPSGGVTEGQARSARVIDVGDVADPDGDGGERRTIALVARSAAQAELVVALGGDNSITVATAMGVFGDQLHRAGLVTLDAHFDLREGISNGSPVRRLIEAGLDPSRIVQIGIADFANSAEYARRARELGITVVHRDELVGRDVADVMKEALDVAGAAGGPVHLDIDVDVCDRSVAPACPASVPGGISAWELRRAARSAARDPRLRSADIVEIDASADAPDGRTVRLAALTVLELLTGVLERPVESPVGHARES